MQDPGSIPGSGRSPGEGIGDPLQFSWASLVVQTVKNPPAMQETWVWSLDWEDSLEEGMATHPSVLAWRIRMDRRACGLQSMGHKESEATKYNTAYFNNNKENFINNFFWICKRQEGIGQTSLPKIGETGRQMWWITAYQSTDSQAETTLGSRVGMGKPEL